MSDVNDRENQQTISRSLNFVIFEKDVDSVIFDGFIDDIIFIIFSSGFGSERKRDKVTAIFKLNVVERRMESLEGMLRKWNQDL